MVEEIDSREKNYQSIALCVKLSDRRRDCGVVMTQRQSERFSYAEGQLFFLACVAPVTDQKQARERDDRRKKKRGKKNRRSWQAWSRPAGAAGWREA